MLKSLFFILLPLFLLLSICPSATSVERLHSSPSRFTLSLFVLLELPPAIYFRLKVTRAPSLSPLPVCARSLSPEQFPLRWLYRQFLAAQTLLYLLYSFWPIAATCTGGEKCVHLSSTFPSLFRPRGKAIKINARGTGQAVCLHLVIVIFIQAPLGETAARRSERWWKESRTRSWKKKKLHMGNRSSLHVSIRQCLCGQTEALRLEFSSCLEFMF